jgi:hypothetical protein
MLFRSIPELIAEGEAHFSVGKGGHHVEFGARSYLSIAFRGSDLKGRLSRQPGRR